MFLCSKANLLEADVWKEFLARPSLPYVLRLLSGLCKGHRNTQVRFYFDLFESASMRATLYLSAKPQYCLEVASTAAILDSVITKTFFKKKI